MGSLRMLLLLLPAACLASGCQDVTVQQNALCDGRVQPDEEGVVDSPFDADGDLHYTDTNEGCVDYYAAEDLDCDDEDPDIHPGAPERCNGEDDDCDGALSPQEADADGDGFSSCNPAGDPWEGSSGGGDCDDGDANAYPGAPERCNDADDDCDGQVDEDPVDGRPFYLDLDGDGYGDADSSVVACSAPDGYVSDLTDCDDGDANVSPGASESACDGVDEDCDSVADEGLAPASWPDDDLDGYGDAASLTYACEPIAGHIDRGGDCDDGDAAIHPDQLEVCDEVDQDCDDAVDEGVQLSFYPDDDQDTYGDEAAAVAACALPPGLIEDGGDCDDQDPAVHPLAREQCDERDEDCDGDVDEGAPFCDPGTSFSLEDAADVIFETDLEDGGGEALSSAGDLDGDGHGDLAIGAPEWDGERGGVGRFFFASGAALPSLVDPSTRILKLGAPWYMATTPSNASMGGAFAALEDGQGRAQLLVGGAHDSNLNPGAVYGFFDALPGETAEIAPSAQLTLTGDTGPGTFGAALSATGDLNCDGYADLVVGAHKQKVGTQSQAGTVYVFLGPVDLDRGFEAAELTFEGDVSYAWAGYSVAILGDLDGDVAQRDAGPVRCDDLAIGVPGDDTSNVPGRVYVIYGHSGWVKGQVEDPIQLAPQSEGVPVIGEILGRTYTPNDINHYSDRLGYSVAGAGDVDGDGHADLLIGAPFIGNRTVAGTAHLFYGDAERSLAGAHTWEEADLELRGSLQGDVGDEHLGASVSGAGDFDGDGYADLLIGAPRWDGADTAANLGAVYVFSGRHLAEDGRAVYNSRSDLYWLLYGAAEEDGVGIAVAGVGDVNDDGKGDVLIGSRRGRDAEGRAYLIYGR